MPCFYHRCTVVVSDFDYGNTIAHHSSGSIRKRHKVTTQYITATQDTSSFSETERAATARTTGNNRPVTHNTTHLAESIHHDSHDMYMTFATHVFNNSNTWQHDNLEHQRHS